MVDDDVTSLTSGLGSDDTLGGDNLSSERCLVLVHINRNRRLIPIRLGFKKILLSSQRSAVKIRNKSKGKNQPISNEWIVTK